MKRRSIASINKTTLISVLAFVFGLHAAALYMLQYMDITPPSIAGSAWTSWYKSPTAKNSDQLDEDWTEAVLAEFFGEIDSGSLAVPSPVLEMQPTRNLRNAGGDVALQGKLGQSAGKPQLGQVELAADEILAADVQLTRRSLEGVPHGLASAQASIHVNQLLADTALSVESTETAAEWLDQAGKIATSDDFHIRVEVAKRQENEGYIYRLMLTPRERVVFKNIRQNIYFLIDRSHSIKAERYEATRSAVLAALGELGENDRFNIIVFDSGAQTMAESPQAVNEQSISTAQSFLASQDAGGLFHSTDLYKTLRNVIPETVDRQEMHTAILLSDGDTFLSQQQQRKAIGKWTRHNAGKVALYSAATGEENNLALLALLSTFNKGRLIYSENYSDLKRDLPGLIRRLRGPIGKELVATVLPIHDGTSVEVYPRTSRLPDLYTATPYSIYGTLSRVDDFYLFLQGKFYDRWLEIKYRVSMENAYAAAPDLEQHLSIQQAYDHYDRYLEKGRRSDLNKANDLLASLKLTQVFE